MATRRTDKTIGVRLHEIMTGSPSSLERVAQALVIRPRKRNRPVKEAESMPNEHNLKAQTCEVLHFPEPVMTYRHPFLMSEIGIPTQVIIETPATNPKRNGMSNMPTGTRIAPSKSMYSAAKRAKGAAKTDSSQ
jgi:uncharacterized protein YgbK (DUF1537 family)